MDPRLDLRCQILDDKNFYSMKLLHFHTLLADPLLQATELDNFFMIAKLI
jgi:hypothetical protein